MLKKFTKKYEREERLRTLRMYTFRAASRRPVARMCSSWRSVTARSDAIVYDALATASEAFRRTAQERAPNAPFTPLPKKGLYAPPQNTLSGQSVNNTGTHPASRLVHTPDREAVSPGGCNENLDANRSCEPSMP